MFCCMCNSQIIVAAAGKNDAIRRATTSQHVNLDQVSNEQSCDFILCQPKGPGDHQAGDCCVNPKDQEITRQVSVASTQRTTRLPGGSVLRQPKEPGDHQAGVCCVNPKDQEMTRRVIVVLTQRTRRSPGESVLCEPKGPGDHQASQCCVNPKDHEITRRVSVV